MSGTQNIRYALVRTSIDDLDAAHDLAKKSLGRGLAASVHIRKVESVYMWDGELCDHPEYEVEFMTTVKRLDKLVEFLQKRHPYDCAEIIKTGFQCLDEDFATWINESCRP